MINLNDRDAAALLASKLDQLTAGLADSDPREVMVARKTLALMARGAPPAILCFVFEALAAALDDT